MGIAPYSEDSATTPFGFGSITITTHQGTWEQSCPPMHWVIDTQTLALTVDSEVAHKSVLDPLGHSLESLEGSLTNLVRSQILKGSYSWIPAHSSLSP